MCHREQVRHEVCVDIEAPTCTDCRAWGHFRTMCVHMLLVLTKTQPSLFALERQHELVRGYFHPSYLIENCVRAFTDQSLVAPQVNFGPTPPSLTDIVIIDSDGEEVDSEPVGSEEANPMRPPFKYTLAHYKQNVRRGRPRTRRFRSSGSASSSSAAAAAPGQDQSTQFLSRVDWTAFE